MSRPLSPLTVKVPALEVRFSESAWNCTAPPWIVTFAPAAMLVICTPVRFTVTRSWMRSGLPNPSTSLVSMSGDSTRMVVPAGMVGPERLKTVESLVAVSVPPMIWKFLVLLMSDPPTRSVEERAPF